MKTAFIMTSAPIADISIAPLCEMGHKEGWEFVAAVPYGIGEVRSAIVQPGKPKTMQIPIFKVMFKKEYPDDAERPKPFEFDCSKPVES